MMTAKSESSGELHFELLYRIIIKFRQTSGRGQSFSKNSGLLLPVIIPQMLHTHHEQLYMRLHHQGLPSPRSDALMVVMVSIVFSWDVTPCRIVGGCQRSPKMLVTTYKTTGIKTQNTTKN
jgi:hypothetical protein